MPAATATIGVASTALISCSGGNVVEVYPLDGDVWVHIKGGTAAAEAVDCIKVLQDKPAPVLVEMGVSQLTAIRVGASDVKVTAWIMK